MWPCRRGSRTRLSGSKRIAASTRAAKVDEHPAYAVGLACLARGGRPGPAVYRAAADGQLLREQCPRASGPSLRPWRQNRGRDPGHRSRREPDAGFGALSYCGHLSMLVNADAVTCLDIDVLAAWMERTWRELAGITSTASGPASDTAPARHMLARSRRET